MTRNISMDMKKYLHMVKTSRKWTEAKINDRIHILNNLIDFFACVY